MTETNNPKAFIFIGRSGCGKGTQVKLFSEKFKEDKPDQSFCYLESGKKFRDFISEETYSSRLSKEAMDEGRLQPEFFGCLGLVKLDSREFKKRR